MACLPPFTVCNNAQHAKSSTCLWESETERALLFLPPCVEPTMRLWKPHNSRAIQFSQSSVSWQHSGTSRFMNPFSELIWKQTWVGFPHPALQGCMRPPSMLCCRYPQGGSRCLTALVHYLPLPIPVSMSLALLCWGPSGCWGAVACFYCAALKDAQHRRTLNRQTFWSKYIIPDECALFWSPPTEKNILYILFSC